ncbi:YihY/virulence factor BrkB family protein [Luedemannella helvata]|uniref:YihY/virulence factor BrkB family protein n=1 Tax=Luedemannella helvata TaxID=349315 RepID=A0ABP4X4J5_9ACTN
MAHEDHDHAGAADNKAEPHPELQSAPPPDAGPDNPAQLGRRSLWGAMRRSVTEFQKDNLTVWAAALTYYGILSVFPGLLVLVAVLGLLSDSLTRELLNTVAPIVPGPARDILTGALENIQAGGGKAGLAAIIGLLIGVWSASGYVAGFMQASNAIYDVPEGRPIWKKLPVRLGITIVTGMLLVASVLIVVISGRLAEQIGKALDASSAVVDTWNIVKWFVLVILVSLMFAILYWAAPNVRHGGFSWVTPGGVVAVILWVVASVLFGVYAANFASYNKTYGALGSVIVFLVWMWLSNLAILYGAELNAELERQRAIAAGQPPAEEPYMRLRDTSKVKNAEADDLG